MGRKAATITLPFLEPFFPPTPLPELQWHQLEQALGKPLDDAARSCILEHTTRLVAAHDLHEDRPRVADAQAEVKKIKRLAVALLEALKPEQPVSADQPYTLKFQLDMHFPRLYPRELRDNLTQHVPVWTGILDYLALESGDGRPPGYAWRRAVIDIATDFKRLGLPTGRSKNVEAARLTPFLRFVKAWQEQLPQRMRRHTQSDSALATGVYEALRGK
jgi:hypothetical protein